jgi:DNA-binding NtrC family response regulator
LSVARRPAPAAHNIDALVIRDAAAMTLAQQIELFDWMTGAGRGAQVLSVTSRPLLSLVQDGRFLEGLFYRLNVVSIAATHSTS